MSQFLRDLLRQFRGKVIVVWDGWTVHGAALKEVPSSRLEAVTRPPDAPELNPVEQVWNRWKWTDLANATFGTSTELLGQLCPHLEQTALLPQRLKSFWEGAELDLPKMKMQT